MIAQSKGVAITPASAKEKKGSKKCGDHRNAQAEFDEESKMMAEVERQIQEEGKRAQREGTSLQGEVTEAMMETANTSDDEEINKTNGPQFTFEKPHALGKEAVTSTRFSENANFLKRSINDLSFTPEPPIRKDPRIQDLRDYSILCQILSKVEALSKTVEGQSAHIIALEKRIEELTSQSKIHLQANKTNRGATKKIESMADRVAAMAATSSTQSSMISDKAVTQEGLEPKPS